MSVTPAIHCAELQFAYKDQAPTLVIDAFQVESGERVFLEGPSGSGKTTLLSLIAGVLVTQTGSLDVLGQPLKQLSASRRDRFRADHVGYIFQMFNLVPYLSVIDNVTLPCRFSGRRRQQAEQPLLEGKRLLEALDIQPTLHNRKPGELSVGQQQRVAVARALIGQPDLIIADEPTSALDANARDQFVTALTRECAAQKTTLLYVSHDQHIASTFDRVVSLPAVNKAVAP